MEGTVTISVGDYDSLKEDSENLTRILKEQAVWSDTCNGQFLVSITKDEAIQKLGDIAEKERETGSMAYRELGRLKEEYKKLIEMYEGARDDRDELIKDKATLCDNTIKLKKELSQLTAIKSKWWYKMFH